MFKKFQALVSGGKKVFDTIKSVKPNVPVTKADKVKRDLRLATQKSKTSQVKLDNTIFRIEQQKKRLEDMQKTKSQTQTRPGKQNLAKGGRVGLKRGTGLMKKKSDVQKIKETFGSKQKPQSRMTGKKKFPDLTGDGKVTFADILKGRGVINGKKKKKVI
jgi:transcriptional regulator NrdR family protein